MIRYLNRAFGMASTVWGTRMVMAKAMINKPIIGHNAFKVFPKFSFSMPQTANKTCPTGGVVLPIIALKTITTPKWIGSNPDAAINGSTIGTNSMILTVGSDSIPRIRNRILTLSMINHRLLPEKLIIAW